jgi:hypothetical protein
MINKIIDAFPNIENYLGKIDLEKDSRTPQKHESCPFLPACEMKKNEHFFSSQNAMVKRLEEMERAMLRMSLLFAKAHMKLMHFYAYAQQHQEVAAAVNLNVAEKIIHDMEDVESTLQKI